MKKRILTALLAVLAACGTSETTQTDTDVGSRSEPSVSVVGDTTILALPLGRSADNGEITVRFDVVTADSRCPTGVQCVWEGNAGIRLTLTSADETEVVIVNSALEPQRVGFVGYAIGFRDLTPYPTSVEPPDPSEYVATVTIVDTRGDEPAPTGAPAPVPNPID